MEVWMMPFLKQLSVSAVAFLVLDYIWLGFIIRPFFMRQLAEIGRFGPDGNFDVLLGPALIVYALMAVSIPLFVMPRLNPEASLWMAFLIGGAMGLFAYGVFDMTNYAVLKNYPLPFALVDMAWGTFLFGAVTVITKLVRDH
jgi:uncharacterized membrane protein